MEKKLLFGVVDFVEPIFAAPDMLGKSVKISVGGEVGQLYIPRLPNLPPGKKSYSRSTVLLAPRKAKAHWEWDSKPKFWGEMVNFGTGHSSVRAAVIDFGTAKKDAGAKAQKIHDGFGLWQGRFLDYVKLYSKQGTSRGYEGGQLPGRIELLQESRTQAKHVAVKSGVKLTV